MCVGVSLCMCVKGTHLTKLYHKEKMAWFVGVVGKSVKSKMFGRVNRGRNVKAS